MHGSKKKSIFVPALLLFLVGLANAALYENNFTQGEFLYQNWLYENITVQNNVLNNIQASLDNGLTNYTIYNNSLILHYSFDSGYGNSSYVVDESVGGSGLGIGSLLGFNGTVIGGNTSFTASGHKFGKAMQFDGVDDFINLTNSESVYLNKMTISAWVNPIGWNQYGQFVSKGNNTAEGTQFELRQYGLQGKLSFGFTTWNAGETTMGFGQAISVNVIPNNTWTFIAGSWNGTHACVYINGLVENCEVPTSSGDHIKASSRETIKVGRRLDGLFLNGSLDELRIWNRSLSASEIQFFYNSSIYTRFGANASGRFVFYEANYSNLRKGNYSHRYWTINTGSSVDVSSIRNSSIHPTIIQCFDETNPSLRLYFNTTQLNSTKSLFLTNQSYYVDSTQPESNDTVTQTINEFNGNYYQRIFQYNELTPQNLSFYLLRISEGQIVRIKTMTTGDIVLTNVLVQVYKSNGTNWISVGSAYSDSTGTATFFLSPTTNYRFILTKTGYSSLDTEFVASSQDYRLYLQIPGTGIVYNDYVNISLGWSPDTSMLNYSPVNQTISFSVSDSGNSLAYYGLYAYYNNSLISFQNISGDANGGVVSISLNTSRYGGALRLAFVGFFAKTSGGGGNQTRSYGISNLSPGGNSLYQALTRLGRITNVNLGPVLTVISLLVILLVSAGLGQGTFVGSGVIGAILLGIFSYWNIVSWPITVTTIMALSAVLFLRSRI